MPVWALYTIVVLIWGSSWYGIEQQLGVVAPQVSLSYRFLLSAVILIGFCAVTRRSLRFPKPAVLLMAVQGLCLFCGNYILFYFAGAHLVSGLLAVCFSTMSMMNILNLALFFRQKIDRRAFVAALIGLTGLCLVFYPELASSGLGSEPALGLGLSLLATYLASLGNMVSVRLKALEIPVIQSNTIGMSFGALFCVGFALAAGASFNYDPRPAYIVSLIGLALFATVIGFGCYLHLVQRIGAARAAYTSVMFPIVALTLSTFLEGYRWSPLAGLGFALVMSGNLLVLWRPREKKPDAAAIPQTPIS
ncbi:DMT family transporter [Dongia rigui]|uniref:DMT family transporter n=1 Tax=Dongia rigui TaxID=940149 RepID=A0ABU5DVC1_9PROT|nr:DMT family transporter [Dongia rigui]MDY0871274.1 DMT family transporter [Dongia rigui]